MNILVYIGSTPVDIGEQSISIVLRSPLFSDNEKSGSFIFNFSIPLTDPIKKELSFVNRPSSYNKSFFHPMQIRFGALSYSGEGKITTVAKDSVEISLPLYNGLLPRLFLGKKLTSITTDNIPFLLSTIFQIKSTLTHLFEVSYSAQNYFTTQLNFNQLIRDSSSIYLSPNSVQIPETSRFNIFIKVDIITYVGHSEQVVITKNGTAYKYFTFGDIGSSRSCTISFADDLNQGDVLAFIFEFSLENINEYPDPDMDNYSGGVEILSGSFVQILSNFEILDDPYAGYPSNNFIFAPVHNPNFYSTSKESKYFIDTQDLAFYNSLFPVLNYFKDGFLQLQISGEKNKESHAFFNTISPYPFLGFVISSICAHFKITIAHNAFEDDLFNQICLFTNNSNNRIDHLGFNDFSNSYNISDSLPDIPIIEFLTNICTTLGIRFHFNSQNHSIEFHSIESILKDNTSIDFNKGIISSPSFATNTLNGYKIFYDNLSDPYVSDAINPLEDVNLIGSAPSFLELPVANSVQVNDCFFCIHEDAYFVLRPDTETNIPSWIFYSLNFSLQYEKLPPDDSEELNILEFPLPCAPILLDSSLYDKTYAVNPIVDDSPLYSKRWIIPRSDIPGNISGNKRNPSEYLLMIFRGIAYDTIFQPYPFLSNKSTTTWNLLGADNPLDFSLSENENSLFIKQHKLFLDFKVNSPGDYTFVKLMNTIELSNFDFFKFYQIGGTDFLIKEIKFEISNKGISPAQITAIPKAKE